MIPPLTIKSDEARFHLALGGDWWAGIEAADVAFLQHLWRIYPALRSVVELGTSYGCTALLLGLLAKSRRGRLVTIDHKDVRPVPVQMAWLNNMTFVLGDLLENTAPMEQVVRGALNDTVNAPWLLMSDGGDKIEELRIYSPLAHPGDVVLVHDFLPTYEADTVNAERCAPYMDRPGWRRLEWDVAEAWGSYFRAWVRVA